MRLVFFGSSPFGLATLESLMRSHEVAAIVTQPDRPAGRGAKLRPTPIAAWAENHAPDIALLKPESVNDPEVAGTIRGLDADAWVVIAFGQKLSQGLLDGVFAINLHASLLPRWRGAAPIQAAVLAGDSHTGNSVITLADRMDAGLVLAQGTTPIGPSDTSGDLHDRLANDGASLIAGVLDAHLGGTIDATEQDESEVTLAAKIRTEHCWVNFTDTAERCRWRINALSPKPGVRVQLRDMDIKLLRSRVETAQGENPNQEAGEFVDSTIGLIACAGGTMLRILEVQPAGKKPMSWGDFARGQRIEPGERLIGA